MIFTEELNENLETLQKPLQTCIDCIGQLRDESLLSFYAYILAIGNYINTVHTFFFAFLVP